MTASTVPTKKLRTEDCPACEGSGLGVRHPEGDDDCAVCAGTGQVLDGAWADEPEVLAEIVRLEAVIDSSYSPWAMGCAEQRIEALRYELANPYDTETVRSQREVA